MKTFTMIIEKDQEGNFIGNLVELPGCNTTAEDVEELRSNMKSAIFVYVSMVEDYKEKELEFIGLERINIPIRELEKNRKNNDSQDNSSEETK